MRIAFATVQGIAGSTNVGRIIPLAQEFTQRGATCFVLLQVPAGSALDSTQDTKEPDTVTRRFVGTEPFRRNAGGKERLKGMPLLFNMFATACRTALALRAIKPDVIIISKPLPANVLGVWFYSLFTANYLPGRPAGKLVLDVDDFELTANKLSSISQRAAVHWSERRAAHMASAIVTASPFLSDHFRQLTQRSKPVTIIPTGLLLEEIKGTAGGAAGGPPQRAESASGQIEHGVGVNGGDRARGTIIAYIGSVSISSGHRVDMLPDILERSSSPLPLKLLVAGDGDDVATLTAEFERRGMNERVRWFGRFTMADLSSLLTPSTIIIDPIDDGIANRAKSSFRVLLAASLGLPVVTSNIGIRPRLVPEKFHERFFAEPGNPASYARKCAALAEQPLTGDERHELQEHATAFGWNTLGARYWKILSL